LEPSNPNYLNNRKKLKTLLLKKPPPDKQYRLRFWLSMSGAQREKELNKGYYYKIIYQYPEYIPSKCESVIEADLKRTCPNEEYFKKPENKKKLKNILIAYSRRNSQIGYCQGFNFIVAKLLKLFEREEDVFWIFVQIIENILPCEYYSELVGIMSDCSLCLELLKESNKKVMKKLEGFEVVLNNLLYKWFISLFVENTSHDTFLNIWDAMMIDGNIVLLRAVSSILEFLENRILQDDGMEYLTTLFEEKISTFVFNRDKLMKSLLNEKLKFTQEQIEKQREQYSKSVINTLIRTKKNEVKKTQVDINGVEIECDLDYPFCLKVFEEDDNKNKSKEKQNKKDEEPLTLDEKEKYKKQKQEEAIKDFQLKNIQLVQTFRSNNPIVFKPNYFQKNNELKEGPFFDEEEEMVKSRKLEAIFGVDPYQTKEKKINVNEKLIEKVKVYQNLLIHRDEHLCGTKKQTSNAILAQDTSNDREELSKSITFKSNAAQNYLYNFTKDVNKNEITSLIGSVQKSFISSSELEIIGENEKNIYKSAGHLNK